MGKILTFYYVWYGVPWGPAKKWMGWNAVGYNPDIIIEGKRHIATADYPLDGVYDSLSIETLNRHIMQMNFAGIDGVILSWWGFNHYSNRVLEALLEVCPKDFTTIYYETAMTLKLRERDRKTAINKIIDDLGKILRKYATKDGWIKLDGKPLLVIYIADQYTVNEWSIIRTTLEDKGYSFFLLGDTFNLEYLKVFDGLHTYNPIKITRKAQDYKEIYSSIGEKIRKRNKLFAATVCPGYDDRKIRRPGIYIPRQDGKYYHEAWIAALKSNADMMLITSWNEWLEGTEIEPSLQYEYKYLYITKDYVKIFKDRSIL